MHVTKSNTGDMALGTHRRLTGISALANFDDFFGICLSITFQADMISLLLDGHMNILERL